MSALNTDALGNAFRFNVEIEGLLVGGFTEVSGLESEIEYEEYAEGGVNGYTHRLPKRTSYPPIVLKRGITKSNELWDWYAGNAGGRITRKQGSIIMCTVTGEELIRWNFFEAYPVKWSGPELNSTKSEVAVESIEIVHNGLKTVGS
ncbi:phage tail protein [Paenibacillus silviterrae]|uniref:phage tail protein n=1 Tax=Paenibacillus silviterrae TaxID=3242194 RepID=UPI00254375D6|nr:phage tail protein [Paenibacillus chinjuensis]